MKEHTPPTGAPKQLRRRRLLRPIGLVLVGAVIASGGWLGWYRFGRTSADTAQGPVGLQVRHFSNSHEGLVVDRCEVDRAETEAIAYGSLNHHAVATSSGDAVIEVLNAQGVEIGSARIQLTTVSAGSTWQIDAHLKAGFGPPRVCYLGLY